MINLKTLCQVAVLTEDVKKEILEKADSFSSEKTMEMEEFLWGIISADYQNRIDIEKQKLLAEAQGGSKPYSKEEFEKIDDDLFQKLVQKLEAADNNGKIEEI